VAAVMVDIQTAHTMELLALPILEVVVVQVVISPDQLADQVPLVGLVLLLLDFLLLTIILLLQIQMQHIHQQVDIIYIHSTQAEHLLYNENLICQLHTKF